MTNLEHPNHVERIVGVPRHPTIHAGRAVSAEDKVYILHSQECLDSGIDLRECRFSIALDEGIDTGLWELWIDQPVQLGVLLDGALAPMSVPEPEPYTLGSQAFHDELTEFVTTDANGVRRSTTVSDIVVIGPVSGDGIARAMSERPPVTVNLWECVAEPASEIDNSLTHCVECRGGKHGACDGQMFNETTDELEACRCARYDWGNEHTDGGGR